MRGANFLAPRQMDRRWTPMQASIFHLEKLLESVTDEWRDGVLSVRHSEKKTYLARPGNNQIKIDRQSLSPWSISARECVIREAK